eukprot:107475_1
MTEVSDLKSNDSTTDFLEENEKIIFLISGYIRELHTSLSSQVPEDINKTIVSYSWTISKHSMQRIAAAHLISSTINEYMNNQENTCEASSNNDLDILKYIYVRGGALRDCYLLRKIKDIDMVVNIHELSKEYLKHLKKYHSDANIDEDVKNPEKCKCIFYRRYLNKYRESNKRNDIHDKLRHTWLPNKRKISKGHSFSTNDEGVDKILNFESYIVNSDYLMNTRFIINILYHSKLYSRNIKINSKYYGHHWVVKIKHYDYQGFSLNNISFDIVDQTGNTYGRYQTFKEYRKLNGSDNVSDTVSDIDKYDENQKNISVPIYPFPMNVVYYGFTINSIHIDLYNILLNEKDDYLIDFNWENKIMKKYNSNVVNKYNIIGINAMNNKVLMCPSLDVINKMTANFYFWRLVKTAQKFIGKIQKGIWKIDEKYLEHTIKHYALWFDDSFVTKDGNIFQSKLINKFLKWSIENENDYVDRFNVFKYIKFDVYFMEQIKKYPGEIKNRLEDRIKGLSNKKKAMLRKCFSEFGYPKMNI